MTAPLDGPLLARLAAAEEIDLRLESSDGLVSGRPVWVVVVDGDAYVRAYGGVGAPWHRRARRTGRGEVAVGGETFSAALEPVERGPLDARVSAAYDAKYGDRSPGPTQALLTPEAVAATLRLRRA